jgi:hypothetical protein
MSTTLPFFAKTDRTQGTNDSHRQKDRTDRNKLLGLILHTNAFEPNKLEASVTTAKGITKLLIGLNEVRDTKEESSNKSTRQEFDKRAQNSIAQLTPACLAHQLSSRPHLM